MNSAMTSARQDTRLFLGSFGSYAISAMSNWLQPVIVADYVSSRGFSAAEAGFIASAEMVTIALTIMMISRFVPVLRFLPVAIGSVAIVFAATVACIYTYAFPLLVVLRAVVALGFAGLAITPSMILASLPNPQKAFSRTYALSLMVSSCMLAALPTITANLGSSPGFKGVLLLCVVALPLVLLIPADTKSVRPSRAEDKGARTSSTLVYLLAAAAGLVAMAYASVWAFFLLLGEQSGLTNALATRIGAISLFAAIAGSLASPAFARMVGSGARAYYGSVLLVGAGLMGISLASSTAMFFLFACVAMAAMYLLIPALLGESASLDPSGRAAATINAAVVLFGAGGPYAGGLIVDSYSPRALAVFSGCAIAGALILYLLFDRMRKRSSAFAAEPDQPQVAEPI